MKIKIPNYINNIITSLNLRGHSVYMVGGCVRDALLGREAYDFDITTSASPKQIKEALCRFKTIDTGIKHGTVTVVTDEGSAEITTYRIDGKYTDNRRPENVVFTNSLKEDLSRRDFTINAFAYNDTDGLIDLFGGVDDLKNGIIRAIGDAKIRFGEDSLRILRGVRFCAQLGFNVEENTSRAMLEMCSLLKNISRERVKSEIEKTLVSPYAENSLKSFKSIISTALGINEELINYKGISSVSPENDLRFAFLLYKASNASEIMHSLKCESVLQKSVALLCENIYFQPESEYELKKYISKHSIDHTKKLCDLKLAANIRDAEEFRKLLYGIDFTKSCFSVKELNISGDDLIDLGYNGTSIGEILSELLDMVMRNEIKNERSALISQASKLHCIHLKPTLNHHV